MCIRDRYHRRERVHLIYNGVPKPEICDYPDYFEELGIEKGKYILGMCRFVPEKNLHQMCIRDRLHISDIMRKGIIMK